MYFFSSSTKITSLFHKSKRAIKRAKCTFTGFDRNGDRGCVSCHWYAIIASVRLYQVYEYRRYIICHSVWVSRWYKSQSHDPIWYLFQIGKPHVVYNISDTTPLIWKIIHGMAVTKKKLAESRDRMRGHQNTCQCFEVSASFDHLSMSPRLVTRLCISASGGSCLPARSVLSWKCWPLSLQPKFSYFWTKIMFASHAGYTKRV